MVAVQDLCEYVFVAVERRRKKWKIESRKGKKIRNKEQKMNRKSGESVIGLLPNFLFLLNQFQFFDQVRCIAQFIDTP